MLKASERRYKYERELRYFTSGKSFRSLEYQFRISKKAVSYIKEEVAVAIIKILAKIYLNTPTTNKEWLKILQNFKERWNFRNDIGAVNGKHIVLRQRKNCGSCYQNYKWNTAFIYLLWLALNMNSCLLMLEWTTKIRAVIISLKAS